MYKLLKADLHLHTLYSDNIDKLDSDDYAKLGDKYGYDVLALTDHHYCLKNGNWDKLYKKIDDDKRIIKGYELTFLNGHMLVIGKENYDVGKTHEAIKEMYNSENIRILAHPDYNIWSWKRNMVPEINGIEVINDMVYWKQPGKYTGIKSYRKYLLMKQKVSPFANTDCHRKVDFGRVWTGIYVKDNENALDAIKRNRTFATTGRISLEFQSDDGYIMGDTILGNENKLYWTAKDAEEVMIYNGDMIIEKSHKNCGYITPTVNGPYWIVARKGCEMAMSSPIWVEGIETKSDEVFNLIRKNSFLCKLNKRLNCMLELLFEFQVHDNVWKDYYIWLKKFSLERLEIEDLAGKSYDIAYNETKRRLLTAIRVAKGFMIYIINHYIENKTLLTKLLSYIMPQHTFENIMD